MDTGREFYSQQIFAKPYKSLPFVKLKSELSLSQDLI